MTPRARHACPVDPHTTTSGAGRRACAVLLVAATTAAACALTAPTPATAAGVTATFVDLGSAASYSVLAGTGVSNTGAATVLALDLGLSPAGTIAGFPPGTVTGTTHDKDALAEAAQEDRADAYSAAVAQTGGTAFAGDQGGATFHPGLHTTTAAFTNTGTITLDADGDPGSVFVFQIGAALSSAAGSKVVLTDGALANNVYWQVVGAVSLGAGAKYVGTILGAGAVALGAGASVKGRVLTPGTVALSDSPITKPIDDLTAPIVTIDGGTTGITGDTTPYLSGTTDEPAGRLVEVTVDAQTLSTTVGAAGVWGVSAAQLEPGTHDVVATVTDPSQNVGTARQVLTVDTSAPAVTIDGGATQAVRDTTPSISGTTDEPAGSTVRVTVGDQTLATTVTAAGVWAVQATGLSEASHRVEASVTDAADNVGTASQVLVVDLTVPVVTIDGGATRSTSDTSPWTYGTTAEQAGTVVHVVVGGQALTATVARGGTWGVSAATLPAGVYDVKASVSDAAHNTGTASQVLTVGSGVDPTPVPSPRYRPDAQIRKPQGKFVGAGVFDGVAQRVSTTLRGGHRVVRFAMLIRNRGDVTDTMIIKGTPRNSRFTVAYLAGGKNVTRAVVAGTYRTGVLRPGQSAGLTVQVTRRAGARAGNKRTFVVRAFSAHARSKHDVVAAVVTAGR